LKRRDFPEWQVKEKYLAQDGVCAKCGTSLSSGFHRHHKDGNPLNNDPANLELLCERCHYTTFKSEDYRQHKNLESDLLASLHSALYKALNNEMDGATLERVIFTATKMLSISKKYHGLDDVGERLPELHPTLADVKGTTWMDGFQEGLKCGIALMRDVRGKDNNNR